ncbi:hypothetical protein [Nocardia sp. NPDC048505]|uniref:hypothetical protein n=1 Tax=unclassified Nocardia TaxID=2637762 RepID=UPI003401B247
MPQPRRLVLVATLDSGATQRIPLTVHRREAALRFEVGAIETAALGGTAATPEGGHG